MNKGSVRSRDIAMAFTGSLLGAGYVSGQELLQFFGVFGGFGLIGMAVSILMFFVLGNFVMRIAAKTGITEFDRIIVEQEIPWLRAIFGWTFIFFLFGVVVIMTAGGGALLNQIFGIPTILGNALMASIIGIVAMWEAKGVFAAFSITVPLMIFVGMTTGILSVFHLEPGAVFFRPLAGENPLIGNWVISTITFISYNMMAAISILVPIAPDVKDEKTINKGIVQGVIQLLIVSVCILLPLIFYHTFLVEAELPMLLLAERINPVLGMVYSLLLFSGMFGSALSCLYGVAFRIRKYRYVKMRQLILVLVLVAFIGSIIGFRELVGIILPICGYIGFFAMIGITRHYLSIRKKGN